ncbi:MAG: SGNH/GDSL hydrolase family protein [Acidimicrobiales bacterium]
MSPRPVQPEPFIRGAAYPSVGDVPYPRANPSDTARLPADIWHAATVPVGVRLELVGTAEAVDVAYRTTSGNLGYRGDSAGITFSVWRGSRKVCEEEAVLGDGLVRLSLGASAPDKPAIIYLPEGMQPLVQSLTAVKGGISPAPAQPRWIAYGDAITQGWIASGPAQGWAAIAARKAGLDVVNLGFAAAGRGEIVSAEHIAGLSADVISIAYGASCWTRIPHSVGMVAEGFMGFLDVVREGHPFTPIVVASPFVRPDAEEEPNRLGTTLADIRDAIESVTRERIASGDLTLTLVSGKSVIGAEHLGDAIHPDDEGHKRIAAAMSKALKAAMASAEQLPTPTKADDRDGWGFGDRDNFEATDSSTGDSTDDGDADAGVSRVVEGVDDVDVVDDGDAGDTEDDGDAGDTEDDFDDSSVAAASSAS